jgi:hypothetical protein
MQYKLFLDLDGVLVDFDAGVVRATGRPPHALDVRTMWSRLARARGFFEHLGWTADGRALWEATAHLSPVILTGVPHGGWAEAQKRAWCARELGPDVPVVTCLAREKPEHARAFFEPPTVPVLVDDREKHKDGWEQRGGRFIVHRDTAASLAALSELGLDRFVRPAARLDAGGTGGLRS